MHHQYIHVLKYFFEGSLPRKAEVFDILLESGSDINVLNNKGYSPLNTMIMENAELNVEDVQKLLAQGADPNLCVEEENSPLINSLLRWELSISDCLLNAGVNVNHVGELGCTALHKLLDMQKGKNANFAVSLDYYHILIDKNMFPSNIMISCLLNVKNYLVYMKARSKALLRTPIQYKSIIGSRHSK
jgi:ankyrin repeat protein